MYNFGYNLFGCEVGIKFPLVKLGDYDWDELEKSKNPFAIVTMAHLKTMETRNAADIRKQWKFKITKMLYERGHDRRDIINIFRFIDWVMKLPEEAEQIFWEEFQSFEEEKDMPYVTSVERIGFKRGFEEGILEGILKGKEKWKAEGKLEGKIEGLQDAIELGLSLKFGVNGLKLMPGIKNIDKIELLDTIKEAIKTAENLSEIEMFVQS